MKLPYDVLSIIYTYAYCPVPALWVGHRAAVVRNPECKDIGKHIGSTYHSLLNYHENLLKNPKAHWWIISNLTRVAQNHDSISHIVKKNVLENKTPHLTKIINTFYDVNELTNKDNNDKYSLEIMNLSRNPYGYTLLLEQTHSLFDANILSVHPNIKIPHLVEKYRNIYGQNNQIINHEPKYNILYALAHNAYTFDIFLMAVKYQVDDRYLHTISLNTSELAIQWISENMHRYEYNCHSIPNNPSAYQIIKDLIVKKRMKPNKKTNELLSTNTNPQVINLLKTHPEFISEYICSNPLDEAVDIIFDRPDKINSRLLATNTNPRILPLLKKYPEVLYHPNLWANPLIFQERQINAKFAEKIEAKFINELLEEQKIVNARIKIENEKHAQIVRMLEIC